MSWVAPVVRCALIKAVHIPFETVPDSHVCDQSFTKTWCVVSPVRYVVTILFGVLSLSTCEVDDGLPVRHVVVHL